MFDTSLILRELNIYMYIFTLKNIVLSWRHGLSGRAPA
jgi:hypothetical protein